MGIFDRFRQRNRKPDDLPAEDRDQPAPDPETTPGGIHPHPSRGGLGHGVPTDTDPSTSDVGEPGEWHHSPNGHQDGDRPEW